MAPEKRMGRSLVMLGLREGLSFLIAFLRHELRHGANRVFFDFCVGGCRFLPVEAQSKFV
ncbi:hypothetical protein D3C72_2263430 [compost metagenome]